MIFFTCLDLVGAGPGLLPKRARSRSAATTGCLKPALRPARQASPGYGGELTLFDRVLTLPIHLWKSGIFQQIYLIIITQTIILCLEMLNKINTVICFIVQVIIKLLINLKILSCYNAIYHELLFRCILSQLLQIFFLDWDLRRRITSEEMRNTRLVKNHLSNHYLNEVCLDFTSSCAWVEQFLSVYMDQIWHQIQVIIYGFFRARATSQGKQCNHCVGNKWWQFRFDWVNVGHVEPERQVLRSVYNLFTGGF